MKVVAFVASSTHHGNTATAVKRILAGAESAGAETRILYLNDYQIKPCRGCLVCEKTNKCVIRDDDVPTLHEAVREADAYVLGTPTYYGDIAGQFKQFVDRLYPFIDISRDEETQECVFNSVIPVRKPGILVATGGGKGLYKFSSHKKVAYHCLNDINGYLWQEVYLPGTTWNPVAEDANKLAELYELGKALWKHLTEHGSEDKEKTERLRNAYEYGIIEEGRGEAT